MIILRDKRYSTLNLTGELRMNELPKGRPLRFIMKDSESDENEEETLGENDNTCFS